MSLILGCWLATDFNGVTPELFVKNKVWLFKITYPLHPFQHPLLISLPPKTYDIDHKCFMSLVLVGRRLFKI
ncbi:hypothetical protein NIES4071_66990 [Calothrix sp. NIES-4071]|nr:hypothetical protein NIES4071_66990 [Calothrix sp. NIES-4071]BAZ60977.1 hypothetical protein NIES4105_66950 [Calothrix sp. NIES-4105]